MSAKPLLMLTGFAFMGAAVFGLYYLRATPPATTPNPSLAQEGTLTQPSTTFVNPRIGSKTPKITIVEFADFQCDACAQLARTLEAFRKAHPNTVQVIWKDMPNNAAHPFATPAAVAAHCADQQGKFWEYHDALFAQSSILSLDLLKSISTQLALDEEKFNACFDAGETLPIVERDFAEGQALGITATPTMFINGERVIGSASLAELETYVEKN